MKQNIGAVITHTEVIEPLSEIYATFNKVIGIWRILSTHFESNVSMINADQMIQYEYLHNYPDIQCLVDILGDYIFPTQKELKKILDSYIELKEKSA